MPDTSQLHWPGWHKGKMSICRSGPGVTGSSQHGLGSFGIQLGGMFQEQRGCGWEIGQRATHRPAPRGEMPSLHLWDRAASPPHPQEEPPLTQALGTQCLGTAMSWPQIIWVARRAAPLDAKEWFGQGEEEARRRSGKAAPRKALLLPGRALFVNKESPFPGQAGWHLSPSGIQQ